MTIAMPSRIQESILDRYIYIQHREYYTHSHSLLTLMMYHDMTGAWKEACEQRKKPAQL